jgi:hypothetical protein
MWGKESGHRQPEREGGKTHSCQRFVPYKFVLSLREGVVHLYLVHPETPGAERNLVPAPCGGWRDEADLVWRDGLARDGLLVQGFAMPVKRGCYTDTPNSTGIVLYFDPG